MPEKFNPFDTCAVYDQHADRWQMEIDFAEMTPDILDAGTYLPKFSAREHVDDYTYRKSMSCPLDMCRDAVRIRRDNLWRTEPNREWKDSKYGAIIEQLVHDCDGEGTPLDAFMQRAVWNLYVAGVDIVTQMTSAGGISVQTQADAEAVGLRPFFSQFLPTQRPWWSASGNGNIIAVRYNLGTIQPMDETDGGDVETTRFLSLVDNIWRVHTATKRGDDKQNSEIEVTTEEGVHNMDRPPIVKFYYAESNKPGQGAVPLSLLTRAARVARVAMNLKSQADADLLASVTRWLFAGFDGKLEDYGPGVAITTNNPDAKMNVAQGDVNHIAEKRAWLLLYLNEILRLLKFRGSMADVEGNASSGIKLALEHSDLDNELRAVAGMCESAEMEMMRQAVILATGEQIAPHEAGDKLGYTVRYERDFVLEPVAEMLQNVKDFVSGCEWIVDETPEVLRELLRQLAHGLMRQGSAQSDKALQEIEAATFQGIPGAAGESGPAQETPERTLTGKAPRLD